MTYSDEDIASNTMNLLSATSTWVLVRHQWLIIKMRSILTGEDSPSPHDLYQFDESTLRHLSLPETLFSSFIKIKHHLEKVWEETIRVNHPLSGASIFDQLNLFQKQAHLFMHESKELNQQLWRDFTMRDPLTGALTRLTLSSTLLQELNRSKRYQHASTIALIDQDKFKQINDEWGHNIGDKVLVNTAMLIQNNLRYGDKLFRYGGDEWLILMPNTNEKKARLILKRIQKISSNYQHSTNNQAKFNSSFNYGIAESSQVNDVEEWIVAADKDLYTAKNPIKIKLYS
ncbi:MAG TPA: GGDEF domain-containing protein [Methylophilus sp.]